uniref:DUF1308 domain-containing protein n=1 Tax=Vannella robusta TaxID=1487602 RepID=A0A7S4I7H9_9EUKA|mmetsp:Transcript_2163/g.2631  ORF Transcript_2163/g.2631 Transcript_2163/m.2631 type:complete len:314 (+) Transcript_2163:472-1413(+)
MICFGGRLWISVIARKASGVNWRAACTDSKHGVKEKLGAIIQASKENPVSPLILLCIPAGAPDLIREKMNSKFHAVEIFLEYPHFATSNRSLCYEATFWIVVPPHHPYYKQNIKPSIHQLLDNTVKYINLDTSTLLALVSDLTNGKASKLQKHIENGGSPKVSNFITKQVYEEQQEPLLSPEFIKMTERCHLIVTSAAHFHFQEIVQKIGSQGEKKRTEALMKRIRIFEEVDWASELHCPLFASLPNRLATLPRSNTLKAFPLEVFGLGDTIPCMVTATSNQSVVRALREQNIFLRVILHPPRSLLTNKFEFL